MHADVDEELTGVLGRIAHEAQIPQDTESVRVITLFGHVFEKNDAQYRDLADVTRANFEEPVSELDVFDDDFDELLEVSLRAFQKLKPEDQPPVFKEILQKYYEGYYDEPDRLINGLLAVAKESPAKNALFARFIDFIYEKGDDLLEFDDDGNPAEGRFDYYETPAFIANMSPYKREIIHALARDEDDEKVQKLLGMFIRDGNFPDFINALRWSIEDMNVDTTTKTRLERVGRMLLGVEPDSSTPFYTSLQQLYRSIQFEHYPKAQAAEDTDVERATDAIVSVADKEGDIVDLASGSGRIANGLTLRGTQHIVGLDVSDRNTAVARQTDTTGSVAYVQADWKKLPLKDSSSRAVICLGRSLPHAEDSVTFSRVIKEVARITQKGGIFLFDMPDPNAGDYLKNRKIYQKILAKLGIFTPLERIDTGIDGPQDGTLYNRYFPQTKDIITACKNYGFDIEITERVPIPQSNGDFNIYFKARKITPLSRSMPNSTALS